MVRWFVIALIISPWLLFQVSTLLFEEGHLDNPGNHIVLCLLGIAFTALVVYIRISRRWSPSVKTAFTSAWLGAVTGIALVAAYVSTWAHDH